MGVITYVSIPYNVGYIYKTIEASDALTEDGVYYLRAAGDDNVGGISPWSMTGIFIYDTVGPGGNIRVIDEYKDPLYPNRWIVDNSNFTIEINSLDSDVAYYRLRNNNEEYGSWVYYVSGMYIQLPWTITPIGGLHTIGVQFKDILGSIGDEVDAEVVYRVNGDWQHIRKIDDTDRGIYGVYNINLEEVN